MGYRIFSVQLAEREDITGWKRNDDGGRIEEVHESCYHGDVLDCETGVESGESKVGSGMEKMERDSKLVSEPKYPTEE